MNIEVSGNPQRQDEREASIGSRSSNEDQSVRSVRAIKVFGDLVGDENSLSYSPSPMRIKKGLRNITNLCDSSPSHVLPFGTIEFTAKKNVKKLSGIGAKAERNNTELEKSKGSKEENLTGQATLRQEANFERKELEKLKESRDPASDDNVKRHTKKRPNQKSSKRSPVKKHVTKSKFRTAESSATRKVQANKVHHAIREATESVNQTLNASRVAKIDHHRAVAAEVARLREDWLAEKEEAEIFYKEVAKTKREMLDLRRQLSSQYAQNKADSDRNRLQQRLNELDKEIEFKSDVFVQHKQKLKEDADRRRRMSSQLKERHWNERREATSRIELERIEEEHNRLEHKWAGERDAKEYKRQCERERRESFAFRNAEGRRQRMEKEERENQKLLEEHNRLEHKWAGEDDAKEYIRQCQQARRDSFAFRNAEGRRQRAEVEERNALEKIAEHKSYEHKWAGERDAEEYLKKCREERRQSFAFRNAEGRAQRMAEEERLAQKLAEDHERYEHKWAGEKDAEEYLRQCEMERRDSFAFRNAEGRRQRMEQEEKLAKEKHDEHLGYEHKWAGERDAEEYRKRCEKARRESFAFRGRECVRHRAVMDELRNIAKEKEHEYYILKWAAQDDVKEYLGKVAEERRQSFAFRNQEGKRHRDLEEAKRCEELKKEHELEMARSAAQKDVEAYKRKCAERDRTSFIYRGKEVQIRRLITEQQQAIEFEEDQNRRAMDTLARGDVEEYLAECKMRRRLSLAQRAKESRHHVQWKKKKEAAHRDMKSRHTRNIGLDRRYVELAKEKEKTRIALDALRHAKCTFSTSNPFGPLLRN